MRLNKLFKKMDLTWTRMDKEICERQPMSSSERWTVSSKRAKGCSQANLVRSPKKGPNRSHCLLIVLISIFSIVSMVRISRAPISLSTGHQLPAGTRFGIPAYAVHTTSAADNKTGSLETKDAHTEETPLSEFDGLRYYRLRQVPGSDTKHQFATTSNDSLAFGLGVHCCPGRFYASMVVKVIFVELLRFWDIRIPGDETAKGGSPPKIRFMDFSIGADPGALIEIRRRSVQG